MNNVSLKKIPLWRFLVPLAIQVAIVLSIPAQKVLTITTGTTVYLQTAPIDPYDVLRGRYVTLDYEIAERSHLEALPDWSDDLVMPDQDVYVTLTPPSQGQTADPSTVPPTSPWQATSISLSQPTELPAHAQVLKGRWQNVYYFEEQWQGGQLDFGLGEYYIPEAIGDGLEADIQENRASTRAEVKVDQLGNAALVSLWVEDRNY